MKMFATVLIASLLSTAALAQSFNGGCGGLGRDSNGGCNTESPRQVCFVTDANGRTYKSYNMGVGSTVWAQYHAIKACRAQSSQPRSCRPAGCTPY